MLGSCAYNLRIKEGRRQELIESSEVPAEWFHSFQFDCGFQIQGRDPSAKKLHHLCLPPSLHGKTVCDVGAYEGYFSFHAESRGAKRVVAADRFVWDWPGSQAVRHLEAVKRAIGSNVELVSSYVEDLPSTLNEQFDIVLFLGVLYHTPDMMGYLSNIAKITKEVCILETHLDALDEDAARIFVFGKRRGEC
jgi:tRNA (mo5U34)-methyltransferase